MKITITDSDQTKAAVVASAIESWLNNGSGFPNCLSEYRGEYFTVTTKAARKRYPLGRVSILVELAE